MWEYIGAFYLSGVAVAMWQLWLPAYNILKELEPENFVVRNGWTSSLVVLLCFTLLLPFMVLVLLIEEQKIKFIKGFIKGVSGK
jgi:sensor domain CHASE-containing protein|tara:strand:- start:1932 stop:2183 length:252 start_codon:yes stop_codon:yes gene_type:complete